jgi:hypothetical protein
MNSDRDTLAGGLPHSEIPGSPIARISPGLFAACHVLHRLSVPRHPPDALLFALDHRIAVTGDAAPPPRTGPSPMPAPAQAGGGGLYEDTSLGHTRRKLCSAPPRQAKPRFAARAGQALLAPGLSASVTSQLSLHPSINAPPRSPAAVSNKLLRTSHTPWFSALRQWRLSIQLGCPCRPAKALPRRWCLSAPLRCACRAANRRFAGGGGERIRTDDLLLAKQALSQLSYTPRRIEDGRQTTERVLYRPSSVLRLVGQGGFEPPTSRLSSARSNQLSY